MEGWEAFMSEAIDKEAFKGWSSLMRTMLDAVIASRRRSNPVPFPRFWIASSLRSSQ
jgi:hypothetical protein